jgi:hypothetical protein
MAVLRRTLAVALAASLVVAAFQAGCGDTGDESAFGGAGDDSGTIDPPLPPFPTGDGSSGGPGDADPDALGALVVTPPTATINVTIVNGVVTVNAPVTFTASYAGAKVNATWLFDRGELGDVDANGVFTANGKNVGQGIVTARFGAREGSATVKITIKASENGASGADAGADAGFGGLGGVGGEPLGGPVAAGLAGRLATETTTPASAAELGYLYPYDKTVWPRGLLAPLVMWQTTHEADAVYVKLSQGNYAFEGTYSLASQPAGSDARKRVRLEDIVWKTATGGNLGDDLQLDVKIHATDDDKIYGPITEKWKVASGVLKGTVYYNSYDSKIVADNGQSLGGIISIKPRSSDPVLAVPANKNKCSVCHTVSADGSTLWIQDDTYQDGASYDLTKGSARTPYLVSKNAQNNRKFVWSAPYPDGSFALASSRFAREAYTQSDAKLFQRSDGAEVPATGLPGVIQSAVTPAFSPDGRKIAFNFWEGAGAGGVTAGAGRSIAIMDFDCGAKAGSVACAGAVDGGPGTGAHTFSNLREIYNDATKYPGWPSFLPDGKAIVFHNTVQRGTCSVDPPDRNSIYNCHLTTWFSAEAELWWAADSATKDARRLDAANGKTYSPTNASHPDDSVLNYEPTVNPVASGGYYWVVFTSRRIYGNLIASPPWGTPPQDKGGPIKKLWVAAIDINAPAGADPSHPAFYLPGQELDAGNTRGFWVVDPCKQNGNSCESGDECCNGFCRKDPDGGALVCMDKPPGSPCSQEFEKCTVDADCCDPKQKCINGKCAQGNPVIK